MEVNKKQTICYLSTRFGHSLAGAEMSLSRLVAGLTRSKKVYPFIISSLIDKDGNLITGRDKVSRNIINVGFSKKVPLADFKNWYKTVSEKVVAKLEECADNVDLIYLNSICFVQSPRLIKRLFFLGKPVILKIPRMEALHMLEKNKKILISDSLRKKLFIHCLSRDIMKQALRFGFDKNQLFFCPNPMDTNNFPVKRPKDRLFFKKRFNLSNELVFIFTGRLDPQKNIGKIVQIFKLLERKKKNIKLFMVGDATHNETVSLVEKLKKQSQNIFWTGGMENRKISPYLRAADCFIMASKDEGMSNSLLEAMACGLCPIVPKNISGMKDLIQRRVNGILYNLNNVESLVRELKALNRNKAMLMGKRARQTVKELCDADKIASAHIKFYKKRFD
jgi:glycosyltransferase involved in cell wall biosynthesis